MPGLTNNFISSADTWKLTVGNGSFQILKDEGNCIIKEEVSEIASAAGVLINVVLNTVESIMAC